MGRGAVVEALLERHGRTYAEELGIDLARGTPSPLFRLLCASLLFSARISADLAVRAARALNAEGWTTARKLAESTWDARVRVLNRSGYARYDERTARMLGETTDLLLERYGGDLRRLREDAGRDPDRERLRMLEFKGLGEVGVDIFFREVQVAWHELYPFADRRALASARALGLADDAEGLAELVTERQFPRLVAALVRTSIAYDHRELRDRAHELAARS
jgi:hypothetical protein